MIAEVPQDVDADTRDWIRNQSDVLAVRNGCTFSVKRGLWTVWWIEKYCRLYEGDKAGEPLILRSCSECEHEWPLAETVDDAVLLRRVRKHLDCYQKGHRLDWQFDCFMRLFGWTKYSDHWKRRVRRFRQASIWVAKKNKKPLALDTPIPTPFGWTTMGELQVGDTVLDERRQPCRVTAVTEVSHNRPCCRVRFSNGDSVVADEEHAWALKCEGFRDKHFVATTRDIRTMMRFMQAFNDDTAPVHLNVVGCGTSIADVVPVDSVPVRCITVDSPNHLYLCGDTGIPTHNSPSLASLGIYLTCGDGEQGQKVFFGAKDGAQARLIVGGHAVEMYRQSEALMAECALNLNLMRLTHHETKSIMEPMSSSNSRTQKSKEGLNGSILIDETHVVDREFIDRISRAGISRAEPLQCEFSTAGDDPDSYGKERFDHAVAVERGEVADQDLFVAVYAAPQNLTDAEIDSDPLKYGYMANPAMGTIVNPEEYLDDYRRSRPKPAEFAKFKMYRLNIWQATSNPWLNQGAWDKCREDYDEDWLKGRSCVAGLDLSRTRDFTALAYAFPDAGEVVRLFVRYFLPQERADEYKAFPQYVEWMKMIENGTLIITPGATIEYPAIRSVIRQDAKKFKITNLLYDPWHAEETTQAIEQGVFDDKHQQIEEGTGIPRTIFRQVIGNFAEPVSEFERRVLNGKLRHNGNPILSWQAQHVHVKADYNGNLRPVKPPKGDMKTIDGIVASIMAFAGCKDLNVGSVYETRGLLRL